MGQIFVAFSEYMNFNERYTYITHNIRRADTISFRNLTEENAIVVSTKKGLIQNPIVNPMHYHVSQRLLLMLKVQVTLLIRKKNILIHNQYIISIGIFFKAIFYDCLVSRKAKKQLSRVEPKIQQPEFFLFIFPLIILLQTSVCML